MKHGAGESCSIWLRTAGILPRTPLDENARADVCIISVGIAGLTTAYLLSLEGRRVIVLDDGRIGSGETERTTAHLVNALDDRYAVSQHL